MLYERIYEFIEACAMHKTHHVNREEVTSPVGFPLFVSRNISEGHLQNQGSGRKHHC